MRATPDIRAILRIVLVVMGISEAACQGAFAARRVTVEQLEKVLVAKPATSRLDLKTARKLAVLELTERPDAATHARWMAEAPGILTRQELTVLCDTASFLDPPPSDLPTIAAPDIAAQRNMLSLTVLYVVKTIPQLPNFLANRVTQRFDDSPQTPATGSWPIRSGIHALGTSAIPIAYRDGRETDDPNRAGEASAARQGTSGLVSWGEFGPVLATTLADAARGTLTWGHWEKSQSGLIAVFRYSVNSDNSHYQVDYCCEAHRVLRETTAYHGTIFIAPATVTILRLTLEADLKPDGPISRAAMMVEYGPVRIGGRDYICPVKSVSISVASATAGPRNRLAMNDVTFQDYHRFVATVSIVNQQAPEAQAPETQAYAESAVPSAPPTNASPRSATGADQPVNASSAAKPAPLPAPVAPEPAAPTSEVSLQPAPGLPQFAPQREGFTLTATARLVDVSFVATDKHGRPVTGLKQSDLEVYDNGARQQVKFFSQASPVLMSQKDSSDTGANSGDGPGPAVSQAIFSNQPDRTSSTSTSTTSTTILLLDEANLTTTDIGIVCKETLKFLHKLAPGEPVALYIMNASGFHVLVELTSDHELLASRLAAWKPDVTATAGAQSALQVLTAVARHLVTLPGHKSLVWISGDRVLVEWRNKFVGSDLNQQTATVAETMNEAHVALYVLDATPVVVVGNAAESDPEAAGGSPANNATASSGQGAHLSATSGMDAITPMQQNLRSIQGPMRELADMTGGSAMRKPNDLAASLDRISDDAQGTYIAAFSPQSPADGLFHTITLKIAGHRRVMLRYRRGYRAAKQPSDLKEEFQEAVWRPVNNTGITLSAKVVSHAPVGKIQLNIDMKDLALDQQTSLWTDKVDVYLAEREDYGGHARISGEIIDLALKPSTFQNMLATGLAYQRGVGIVQDADRSSKIDSLRFIVIDENSGRIGSITVPAAALQP